MNKGKGDYSDLCVCGGGLRNATSGPHENELHYASFLPDIAGMMK